MAAGMDSSCVPKVVLEPSMLTRCRNGWILRQLGHNAMEIEYYEFQELHSKEKLTLEVNTVKGVTTAKDVFGSCVFKAFGNLDAAELMRMTLPDQTTELGQLVSDTSNTLVDTVNDVRFMVCPNTTPTGQFDETFSVIKASPTGDACGFPVLRISYNGAVMSLQLFERSLSTITIGLIFLKCIQLGYCVYFRGVAMPSVEPNYVEVKRTLASPLHPLRNLSTTKLMKSRKLLEGIWYYHIRSTDDHVQLILEHHESDESLRVMSKYGVEQFYAFGVNNLADTLAVNLHALIPLGTVTDGRFTAPGKGCFLTVNYPQPCDLSSYQLMGDNSEVVASICSHSDADALSITMPESLCSNTKALILAYVFKSAYHHYGFTSVKPRQDPDSPVRSVYMTNVTTFPSSLAILDKLKSFSLFRSGPSRTSGIQFYEVGDDVLGEDVLSFLAVEKLGAVEAMAKSASTNKDQFFAYGIWDMKNDLVVNLNSGLFLGMVRAGTFYDCKSRKILMEIKLPGEDVTRPESATYHLVDPNTNDIVVEIKESSGQLHSEIKKEDLGVRLKAIIISYVLKLAYNAYRVHRAAMRERYSS